MLGQVNVLNLPQAAEGAQGPPRTIPFLVPNPQTLAQEKRMALQPNFVPPGNEQKQIVSTNLSGPQSVSAGPGLGGAPGGSPNPCDCSPPDVIVDVGSGYVFEMVNLAGIVYSTSGTVLKNTFALSGFFGLPTSSMSDPYVLYDVLSGRWFASVIDIPNNAVQFAVSISSNPTGTWNIYSVKTGSYLPDQPFIGSNDDKFVISANDFACVSLICTFRGVQYWVLSKSELVSGASTIDYATNAPDSTRFSVHPARHLGSSSGYFYMVTVGSGSTSTASMLILSGVPPGPVTVTPYSFAINSLSNPPDAQQPGTSTLLNTNDDRVLSAVWLTNNLWFTGNDACLLGGDTKTRSCLRLVQLTTSGTAAPTKGNDFDYALSGNYYFYPAVSLDNLGNAVVVYGRSSSAVYPSLYVTAIQSNGFQTPALIPSGSASDLSNRYGDYFGAGTDFSTSTFWVAGEYRTDCTFQKWSTSIVQVSLSSTTGSFDFSMSNSGGITVTQGGSGTNTITVTLTSGTTQTVSLSCNSSTLPSGAGCSFNPASASPTYSSTLTVTTSSSTPTGSSTVSVIGTGGGLTRSTSFTLTVNPPTLPALSVSVTTNKGSYAKGSTVTITVTVTSSGAAVNGASVSITIIDPIGAIVSTQSGITGSGGTVKFTWTIPLTAVSGVYTVKATASATGYASGSVSTIFRVR